MNKILEHNTKITQRYLFFGHQQLSFLEDNTLLIA